VYVAIQAVLALYAQGWLHLTWDTMGDTDFE